MIDDKTFYITTPIYYVNDVPHIGHAYTTVACDVMARYKRLTGHDVFFLTGTDEHGQKIEKSASERGMTNKEFVDSVTPRFKELAAALDATNDDFIRTTEDRHKQAVSALFTRLQEAGAIYKGAYEDWYCVPCESFWTEMQLAGGNCPDCGRPVEKLKEESYFFRLSEYGGEDGILTKYLEANPDFVKPKSRYNEVYSFVKGGLHDLSISRTSFDWGIHVPDDEKHVVYVWLDALTNYISALGYPAESGNFEKYWPADFHVIGKDILRFHAVYWPAFLLAAGLPLPKTVFSHGWWTIAGEKMSKSRGNVVDPFEVVKEFGADAFRYFLLREVTFGLDGDYSKDALTGRVNSDLANDLGNLHFRTINMIQKYLGGEVPSDVSPADGTPEGELNGKLYGLGGRFSASMDGMAFSEALREVWEVLGDANRMVDHAAPWTLAKSESAEDKMRLSDVLGVAARVVKAAAVLLHPFMPDKTQVIWEQLGHDTKLSDLILKEDDLFFAFEPDCKVTKGEAPFPRIDTEKIKEKKAATESGGKQKQQKQKQQPPETKEDGGRIMIDDFMKVDLKAGRITEAERVPKSDKLIKMMIDIGEEAPRQIVGGLGLSYGPDELVGMNVVVVSNLKPAKLMGIRSEGMVLAAGDPESLRTATFLADMQPGTKVK